MAGAEETDEHAAYLETTELADAKISRWFGLDSKDRRSAKPADGGAQAILAGGISTSLAMAAGATRADVANGGEQWVEVEIEFDPTDPNASWKDEASAVAWAAANVRVRLESSADGRKLRLVFLNPQALPDAWMFAAVGLRAGQKPEVAPPPGAAGAPYPWIAVGLAAGYNPSDLRRLVVYVTEYGMVLLGYLMFRICAPDKTHEDNFNP